MIQFKEWNGNGQSAQTQCVYACTSPTLSEVPKVGKGGGADSTGSGCLRLRNTPTYDHGGSQRGVVGDLLLHSVLQNTTEGASLKKT